MRATYAQIDLSAIAHNVSLVKKNAGQAEMMAVVKADAYGHGAIPVARTALENGAKWLAVATAEEAEELREKMMRKMMEEGIDEDLLEE